MNAPKNTRATFSERLARLQVGDTSADLWASYERACLYELAQAGCTDDAHMVNLEGPCDPPTRFRLWLAHNLLKCIEDIRWATAYDEHRPRSERADAGRREHVLYVFRGYVQAREYVGRVKGELRAHLTVPRHVADRLVFGAAVTIEVEIKDGES